MFREFADALQQVLRAIDLLKPEADSSQETEPETPIPIEMSVVAPLFERLAELLRDDDMAAIDCVEALKEDLKGTDAANVLHEIENAIGHYDFEQALEHLNTIVKNVTSAQH